MQIAELFTSRQGEGLLTGTDSFFIRTSGCNLRCSWCDTPYASWEPQGEPWSVEGLVERAAEAGRRHVVVTGGEPMLYPELVTLSRRLRTAGHHVTIETAGTRLLPVESDLMSISPKMSNSTPSAELDGLWQRRHERSRRSPHVVRRLIADSGAYQLKFVVATPGDAAEVERYLVELPEVERGRVMLMPQGTDPERLDAVARWLVPYCRSRRLVYCPRKQIEWYGYVRGT